MGVKCPGCNTQWDYIDGVEVVWIGFVCPSCGYFVGRWDNNASPNYKKETPPVSSNLNLELLIKVMRLTESDKDYEALSAIRKANEHLKRMKWDWERLLRGKVTLAADPFVGVPDIPTRPSSHSYAPPPPPQPQPAYQPPPPPQRPAYRPRSSTKPKRKGYVDLGNAI